MVAECDRLFKKNSYWGFPSSAITEMFFADRRMTLILHKSKNADSSALGLDSI